MAIRFILTDEDETLRKKSRPITSFDHRLHVLIDDMFETMYENEGVGLAAVQVGVLRRVVVIDVGEGKVELINPEIIAQEGEQTVQEGCLSVPGKRATRKRPAKVKVRAFDRNGEPFEFEAEELFAVAVCHECAHLDGELFYDDAIEVFDEEYEDE